MSFGGKFARVSCSWPPPVLALWRAEARLPEWGQLSRLSIEDYLKRFCRRPGPQVGEGHEAIPDSLNPGWQSHCSLPGGL